MANPKDYLKRYWELIEMLEWEEDINDFKSEQSLKQAVLDMEKALKEQDGEQGSDE